MRPEKWAIFLADFHKKQKLREKGRKGKSRIDALKLSFSNTLILNFQRSKAEILCYNVIEKMCQFDMSGPGSFSRNDAAAWLRERGG